MFFTLEDGKLCSPFRMNGVEVNVALDTMSRYTVFSKETIAKLCDEKDLKRLEASATCQRVVITLSDGTMATTRPCLLVDAQIDGASFDLFPCYVRLDDKKHTDVIGLDLILQCKGIVARNTGIRLCNVPIISVLVAEITETQDTLVLGLDHEKVMSYRDVCSIIVKDNSLIDGVAEFACRHSFDDTKLFEIMLSAANRYDIKSIRRFSRLMKEFEMLEKEYMRVTAI